MATFEYSFKIQIDESAVQGSTQHWAVARVEMALEDMVRGAIGLAVPFAAKGIPVQVYDFKMKDTNL